MADTRKWNCKKHVVWNLSCSTCKDAMNLRSTVRTYERLDSTATTMRHAPGYGVTYSGSC